MNRTVVINTLWFVFDQRRFSVGFFCGWCCALTINTLFVLYVF